MSTVNEKMTAIADQVRQLSGVTSALGLDAMAQTIQTENELFDINLQQQNELVSNIITALDNKVSSNTQAYEQGKKDEYDFFWDTVQNNGEATNYENRFWAYPAKLFNPKYDFIFTGGSYYSANNTFRTAKMTDMIKNCDFTAFPAASKGLLYTFYQCTNLVNARTIKLTRNVNFTSPFDGCTSLVEIRIDGEIGQNCSFASCYNLSHDSLMSIINSLVDYSQDGITKTLTLNTTSKNKLTNAEKAIATQKGWTLA